MEEKLDFMNLIASNQDAVLGDFYSQGITNDKVTLKDRDFYKQLEGTKNVFKNQDGTFNEDKYNTFYDRVLTDYNQYTTDNFNKDNGTLFTTMTPSMAYKKIYNVDAKMPSIDVLNAYEDVYGRSKGLVGLNEYSAPTQSKQEFLSKQKIRDNGVLTNRTSEDLGFTELWLNPVREAIYEKDTYDKNGNLIAKKGDSRLDEYGRPYTEYVDYKKHDTSISNYILPTDVITREDSPLNAWNPLDRDDIELNDAVTVGLAAGKIGLFFASKLNPIGRAAEYTYRLMQGISMAADYMVATPGRLGLEAYYSKEQLEGDSTPANIYGFLGGLQARSKMFKTGTSESSKSETFTIENLVNMIPETVGQLSYQRGLNLVGGLAAGEKGAKVLSNVGMAMMSSGELAESMNRLDLDPMDKLLLYGATTAAFMGFYKANFADWAIDKVQNKDLVKNAIKEKADELAGVMNQLKDVPADQKDDAVKGIAAKFVAALGSAMNYVTRKGAADVPEAMVKEGTEEVLEQMLIDGVKGTYNFLKDNGAYGLSKDKKRFDDFTDAEGYLFSAVGGAVGGGAFKFMDMIEGKTDKTTESFTDFALNNSSEILKGKLEEMKNKGSLGNSNLSTEIDDVTKYYKPHQQGKNKSQNDFVYETLNKIIDDIESVKQDYDSDKPKKKASIVDILEEYQDAFQEIDKKAYIVKAGLDTSLRDDLKQQVSIMATQKGYMDTLNQQRVSAIADMTKNVKVEEVAGKLSKIESEYAEKVKESQFVYNEARTIYNDIINRNKTDYYYQQGLLKQADKINEAFGGLTLDNLARIVIFDGDETKGYSSIDPIKNAAARTMVYDLYKDLLVNPAKIEEIKTKIAGLDGEQLKKIKEVTIGDTLRISKASLDNYLKDNKEANLKRINGYINKEQPDLDKLLNKDKIDNEDLEVLNANFNVVDLKANVEKLNTEIYKKYDITKFQNPFLNKSLGSLKEGDYVEDDEFYGVGFDPITFDEEDSYWKGGKQLGKFFELDKAENKFKLIDKKGLGEFIDLLESENKRIESEIKPLQNTIDKLSKPKQLVDSLTEEEDILFEQYRGNNDLSSPEFENYQDFDKVIRKYKQLKAAIQYTTDINNKVSKFQGRAKSDNKIELITVENNPERYSKAKALIDAKIAKATEFREKAYSNSKNKMRTVMLQHLPHIYYRFEVLKDFLGDTAFDNIDVEVSTMFNKLKIEFNKGVAENITKLNFEEVLGAKSDLEIATKLNKMLEVLKQFEQAVYNTSESEFLKKILTYDNFKNNELDFGSLSRDSSLGAASWINKTISNGVNNRTLNGAAFSYLNSLYLYDNVQNYNDIIGIMNEETSRTLTADQIYALMIANANVKADTNKKNPVFEAIKRKDIKVKLNDNNKLESLEGVLKEVDTEIPYSVLQNISFIDGNAGVGKSMITRFLAKLSKPDDTIFIVPGENQRQNLLNNLKGDLETKDPVAYEKLKKSIKVMTNEDFDNDENKKAIKEAKHIVVDETQSYNHEFLRKLANSKNKISLLGDTSQLGHLHKGYNSNIYSALALSPARLEFVIRNNFDALPNTLKGIEKAIAYIESKPRVNSDSVIKIEPQYYLANGDFNGVRYTEKETEINEVIQAIRNDALKPENEKPESEKTINVVIIGKQVDVKYKTILEQGIPEGKIKVEIMSSEQAKGADNFHYMILNENYLDNNTEGKAGANGEYAFDKRNLTYLKTNLGRARKGALIVKNQNNANSANGGAGVEFTQPVILTTLIPRIDFVNPDNIAKLIEFNKAVLGDNTQNVNTNVNKGTANSDSFTPAEEETFSLFDKKVGENWLDPDVYYENGKFSPIYTGDTNMNKTEAEKKARFELLDRISTNTLQKETVTLKKVTRDLQDFKNKSPKKSFENVWTIYYKGQAVGYIPASPNNTLDRKGNTQLLYTHLQSLSVNEVTVPAKVFITGVSAGRLIPRVDKDGNREPITFDEFKKELDKEYGANRVTFGSPYYKLSTGLDKSFPFVLYSFFGKTLPTQHQAGLNKETGMIVFNSATMTLKEAVAMANVSINAWKTAGKSKEKAKEIYGDIDEHIDFVSASRLIDIIFDLGIKSDKSPLTPLLNVNVFSKPFVDGVEVDADVRLKEKDNFKDKNVDKYKVDKLAFVEMLSNLNDAQIKLLEDEMKKPERKLQRGFFMPILFSKSRTDSDKYLSINNKDSSFTVDVKILSPNINIDSQKLIDAIDTSLGVNTTNEVYQKSLSDLSVAFAGKPITMVELEKAAKADGTIINKVLTDDSGNKYAVYQTISSGIRSIRVRNINDLEKDMKQFKEKEGVSVLSVEFNQKAFEDSVSTNNYDTWFNIQEAPKPAATQEEENKAVSEFEKEFSKLADIEFNGAIYKAKDFAKLFVESVNKASIDNSYAKSDEYQAMNKKIVSATRGTEVRKLVNNIIDNINNRCR